MLIYPLLIGSPLKFGIGTFCMFTMAKRLLVAAAILATTSAVAAATCRCLPSDDCWPNDADWRSLNETVQGCLTKVTPIGAVCHDPTYDEVACAELQASWNDVKTQYAYAFTLHPTKQEK